MSAPPNGDPNEIPHRPCSQRTVSGSAASHDRRSEVFAQCLAKKRSHRNGHRRRTIAPAVRS